MHTWKYEILVLLSFNILKLFNFKYNIYIDKFYKIHFINMLNNRLYNLYLIGEYEVSHLFGELSLCTRLSRIDIFDKVCDAILAY